MAKPAAIKYPNNGALAVTLMSTNIAPEPLVKPRFCISSMVLITENRDIIQRSATHNLRGDLPERNARGRKNTQEYPARAVSSLIQSIVAIRCSMPTNLEAPHITKRKIVHRIMGLPVHIGRFSKV